MKFWSESWQRLQLALPGLRKQLAFPQTSLQLCILGALGGLLAAILIILFRLAILALQSFYLDKFDDFATALPEVRWLLPFAGAFCIGLIALLTGYKHYRLGIPFVIHRIKTSYGMMPFRNTFNQFFGGVAALASGFSVGREGPSVHLGAYGASFVGKKLKLPYNSVRTLVGCGIAAGIAASFNTPLAAVIFVMEVVLREYRIHIFIPVMLAAVVGALVTRLVFGMERELAILQITTLPGWHFPYLILCGVLIGMVAFVFNTNMMRIIRTFKNWPLPIRLLLAAAITAAIGMLIPQAMGAETGAIQYAVEAPTDVQLLLALFIGKMVLTLVALGLGVPGGVVGPIFGIGIIFGTLLALVPGLLHGHSEHAGTYAVLGMAGLMAACLHAPLAALVAVMELASNPDIILPAMLVIATAYVTGVQFCHTKSLFLMQLDFMQLPYKVSPALDVLQKVGVLAQLDHRYHLLLQSDETSIRQALDQLAADELLLLKSEGEDGPVYQLVSYDVSLSVSDGSALRYLPVPLLTPQATMAEVYQLLETSREGAVCILDEDLGVPEPAGLVRWDQVQTLLVKENNLL
ncbi:chloride channel protein [Alkalimonas delamerensis]|uniref:Chloride channel protein n=1 Tax=Alkalimonas delamerensis TaxID=265981 RepID=A0ABT9GLK1_9GAMM|nr:chloride channel protein [Alkalimonas delamerensis]MDP4527819.1 chloride channel protein [Alkalimonas delamerensis]